MLQVILGDKDFCQHIGEDTYIGTPTYAWFEANCLSAGYEWLSEDFPLTVMKTLDNIHHLEDNRVLIRNDGTALALAELSGDTLALLTLYFDPILNEGRVLIDINFGVNSKGIDLVEELASQCAIKICSFKTHIWRFTKITEVEILNYGDKHAPALAHNQQELQGIYERFRADRFNSTSSSINSTWFKKLHPYPKVTGHLIISDSSNRQVFNLDFTGRINIITSPSFESRYLEQICQDTYSELSCLHEDLKGDSYNGRIGESQPLSPSPYWQIKGLAGDGEVEVYYFKDISSLFFKEVYQQIPIPRTRTPSRTRTPTQTLTRTPSLPPTGSIIIISEEASRYLPVQGKGMERFISTLCTSRYYTLIYSPNLLYYWPGAIEAKRLVGSHISRGNYQTWGQQGQQGRAEIC